MIVSGVFARGGRICVGFQRALKKCRVMGFMIFADVAGAKPANFIGFIGTTKVMPCYKALAVDFFSTLFTPCVCGVG